MRVVILDTPEAVSRRAADIFCQTISQVPTSVLGLATGSTPLGTYQELIQRHRNGQVHFSKVSTFNLDEYVGLTPDHEQSYWYFMCKNLFELADFRLERCFIPDGSASDLSAACQSYEQLIAQAGGIDLQLLGIGSDGHIAFNEPGSSLASRTRVKALTERTRNDNARFFQSLAEVPKLALTMGVGTILDARHVVLLATGKNKSAAVRALVEGPVTAQVPASALQLHPRVTVLMDQGAAQALSRVDYYVEVEKIQRQLEEASAASL
jgi:glucosamine-6-phosphate deaminase